jgi:hypothetical protein
VHSDVWGSAPLLSNDNFHYYVLFIVDFTKFTWIYFLHSKDELLNVFILFKLQAENQLNTTIKTLRTDSGTEYKPIARTFPQLTHQITCLHTPEKNGLAKCKHRHVIELSLAIISRAALPLSFWVDIFSNMVFLINRLPHTSSISTPYYLLYNSHPDYLMLRTLGCLCFLLVRPYNSHKLQPRGLLCVHWLPIWPKGLQIFSY